MHTYMYVCVLATHYMYNAGIFLKFLGQCASHSVSQVLNYCISIKVKQLFTALRYKCGNVMLSWVKGFIETLFEMLGKI